MKAKRHNKWITLSQLLLLLLICVLAWQGISAARTQERMVRELLADYAELIAENAERGLNASLGYRSFYGLIQWIQVRQNTLPFDQPWPDDAFDDTQDLPLDADRIRTIAVTDGFDEPSLILWNKPGTSWPEAWPALLATVSRDPAGTGVFHILHPNVEDQTQLLMRVSIPGSSQTLWLWFEPELVSASMAAVLANQPLLPEVLGDAQRLRPNINIVLKDPLDQAVWSTEFMPPADAGRVRIITGDYSGLLKGYSITASINPDIAGELVIGGLPYGRLPFIAALVLVAILLGVLGFVLHRRQREVHQMRDDFVARVSHELRTPLTQIRMFAETLLYGRISSEEEQRNALAIINRETLRLGNMVDSILQFENPHARTLPREKELWSLAQWCNSTRSRFEPLLNASEAKWVCEIDEHAYTRINRDAMTQILGNLVDNALKYGPHGQQITIECQTGEGDLFLKVTDQGPGIPAHQSDAIFEPYLRLARDKKSGTTGTGIGLSVARDLARSMGGDLLYEHGKNAGFVLRIPGEQVRDHG